MYNSGRLNRKIYFWTEVETEETNEIGDLVKIPQCIKSGVWAEMIPQTGSLMTGRTADTILSKTTHKFKIRYNATIENYKPRNVWIVYKNKRFDIDYILNPKFSNEFLEIFCQEFL